jgi:hypothetical protein
MPLPRPKKNESKQEFISRFMGDAAMNKEYPDNDQRYAVANSVWEKKQKMEEKFMWILEDESDEEYDM